MFIRVHSWLIIFFLFLERLRRRGHRLRDVLIGMRRRRQLIVVAISCVAFLEIVGFSAQRLLKAMKA